MLAQQVKNDMSQNEEKKKEESEKLNWFEDMMKHKPMHVMWFVIIVYGGFAALVLCITAFSDFNMPWAGTLGDVFGAINALFSGLAFAGLIYTISQQSKEMHEQQKQLKLQAKQLKLQKKEIKETNIAFREQNRLLHLEHASTHLFRLLEKHSRLIQSQAKVQVSQHSDAGRPDKVDYVPQSLTGYEVLSGLLSPVLIPIKQSRELLQNKVGYFMIGSNLKNWQSNFSDLEFAVLVARSISNIIEHVNVHLENNTSYHDVVLTSLTETELFILGAYSNISSECRTILSNSKGQYVSNINNQFYFDKLSEIPKIGINARPINGNLFMYITNISLNSMIIHSITFTNRNGSRHQIPIDRIVNIAKEVEIDLSTIFQSDRELGARGKFAINVNFQAYIYLSFNDERYTLTAGASVDYRTTPYSVTFH
jgi:hypothetical protein